MSEIRKATELSLLNYVSSLGLNPDNVFYQRVKSNNVTTANAQWQVTSPNKRSYLLSYLAVDWQPRIDRQQGTAASPSVRGAHEPNEQDPGGFSFKELFPFANAMTSISVSVNGNNITLSQPRRFMKCLQAMCVTREEARSCFESEYWHSGGGQFSNNRPGQVGHGVMDEGLLNNEKRMLQKWLESAGTDSLNGTPVDVAPGNATSGVRISHQEPLICPPFNPFAKVVADMPEYMWFKHMSPIIPNIDRLEIDIQFNPQKIEASSMFYRYTRADNVNVPHFLQYTDLQADLLLYWYEVPPSMEIPRSIDLQTWNIREFQTSVGEVVNGALSNNIKTDLIQLKSVPTLIIIHAERNKDGASYQCVSYTADDDMRGTAPPVNQSQANSADGVGNSSINNSLDDFMEIVSMNVILGDRPSVINTRFTQNELYYLTLQNSKIPFPYSYNHWKGYRVANIAAGDNAFGTSSETIANPIFHHQSGCCFVALRPKQLAEKFSDGVLTPTTLQFEMDLRAKSGACGLQGGNHSYTLFTHLYFGKHFLKQEPDRSQFQEQLIDMETARRATKPNLGFEQDLGLGGSLSRLRLKSEDPRYVSRV